MTDPTPGPQRSIGLTGAFRFALAVAAVIVVAAALNAHKALLALVAAAFFIVAAIGMSLTGRSRP